MKAPSMKAPSTHRLFIVLFMLLTLVMQAFAAAPVPCPMMQKNMMQQDMMQQDMAPLAMSIPMSTADHAPMDMSGQNPAHNDCCHGAIDGAMDCPMQSCAVLLLVPPAAELAGAQSTSVRIDFSPLFNIHPRQTARYRPPIAA